MPWVKVPSDRYDHGPFSELSQGAKLLFNAAECKIAANFSDGEITPTTLRLAAANVDVKPEIADELVNAGLWERTSTGWRDVDYLTRNPSREQYEAFQASRHENGRKGGRPRRAAARADTNEPADSEKPRGNLDGNHEVTYTEPTEKAVPVPVPVPVPVAVRDNMGGIITSPIRKATTPRDPMMPVHARGESAKRDMTQQEVAALTITEHSQHESVAQLTARGITNDAARVLAATHTPDHIARHIDIYDCEQAQRGSDDPLSPGWLRNRIVGDWPTPPGYADPDERVACAAAHERLTTERRSAAARREGESAVADAANTNRLNGLGLTAADQAVWSGMIQTPTVLPSPFRGALFYAPKGRENHAAVIFSDTASLEHALRPDHRKTRKTSEGRIATFCQRFFVQVRYIDTATLRAELERPIESSSSDRAGPDEDNR